MRFARLMRRALAEGGYTLLELVVAGAIFLTVATVLTTLFVSGARSELDQNRRFQAQQEARLALERLRREVHCASAIATTSGAASSITVTLSAACPSADTSVVWSTELVSSGRYRLKRGNVVVADYLTSGTVFTYYAPSSSSLGRLHVDFPVDVHPSVGSTAWELIDDVVLMNTVRS